TGQRAEIERHLHFIPSAKLIVVIPQSNDKLHLYRFDLEEALEKSGIDYLLVTSRPPQVLRPGSTLTYQVQVKSKKGGVRYKLESGPPGMKLSEGGRLTWPVPAGYAQPETDVLITVSDAAGQEIFHTFRVSLNDRANGP